MNRLAPFDAPLEKMVTDRAPLLAPREISLHDIVARLLRNRLLILGCFALVVIASVLWLMTVTPIYEATGTLRIDEKQSNLPVLDVLKSLSSGNEVATELEVLRSRTLAQEVVDSLQLRADLTTPRGVPRDDVVTALRVVPTARYADYQFTRATSDRYSVKNGETGKALGTFAVGSPIVLPALTLTLAQRALNYKTLRVEVRSDEGTVRMLRAALKITRPNREANVVTIRYQSPDPQLVEDVPNLMMRRFIALRMDNRKTEARSTVHFLRQQIDTLAARLALSEDELRRFREGAQVVNLQAEATSSVGRLVQLQAERSSLESERAALSTLMAEIQASVEHPKPGSPSPYRRLIAFPTLLRNQAATELLRSLSAVEDQRAGLLTRRTRNDPDVQTLDTRIAELEEQLHSIAATYLQGLTNQRASLDQTLAQYSVALSHIPSKEIEFARLSRTPKVLEDIYILLQTRLQEAQIAQAVEDPSVRVIDRANASILPVKPKKELTIVIACLIGLMLGCTAAVVREQVDRTIHTREEVQEITGHVVLGLIPRIRDALTDAPRIGTRNGTTAEPVRMSNRLITGTDPRNPVSEAYRTLRTNIAFASSGTLPKMLVVSSPMPGDGKTTTSANLAITLAQQGLRVLLVDADLRRGLLHTLLGKQREPGLSNVIVGTNSLDSAIGSFHVGDGISLDFLSTGTIPPNPAELLGSARMHAVMSELRDRYDSIIFDAPPLNIVTDAAVLSAECDAILLVARAAVTSRDGLAYAMEQLRNVRSRVYGVVLNDIDFRRDNRYYGAYGSYSYAYYEYQYAQQKRVQ